MRSLIRTFVLLIAVSGTLVFSGCQKSDPDATDSATTVAQDKAFITGVSNQTNQCITDAKNGNLAQSIIQFLNVSNGVSGNQAWADNMSNQLEAVMGTLQLDPNNNKFDFIAYRGNYTWNRTTQTFTKTPATGIFIFIPSTPAQLTNNVTISLSTYTDGLYQINAANQYLPKTAVGTVTKDNVVIASLNLNAVYATPGFPAPANVSYSMLLAPHSYDFNVQRITSTQFKFTSNIISGAGCGMHLNSTVTFRNDDYDNFVLEDDLKSVTADYITGDLTIKATWDAMAYYQVTNPTTSTLNNTLRTDVYNKTVKIAELKFADVSGARKLLIYYRDGTFDNVSVYYEPFLTNLKNTLRPIFGNDVDTWFNI